MSIQANHHGTCTTCYEPVEPGDWIDRTPQGWRHAAGVCPEPPEQTADRQALTHPRCTVCGSHHPGEC